METLCDAAYISDNALGKYIKQIANTPIQEINPDLQGGQQDLPNDEKIKHEIDKIITETCETDDEKEIILNEIIVLQKRVTELMKSRRGLPFYGLLSRWFDTRDIIHVMDENEILITSVLKDVIPNIHNNNIYKLYRLTMEQLIGDNQDIVNQIIEIFMNASPSEYKNLVAKMFIPSEEERNEKGEVSTKPILCVEMCDLHNDRWNNMGLKWFEPCCGKGNFILEMFDRLYLNLDIEDDEERCEYIIEECLYFVDINEINVFICEVLLVAQACSYTGIWKQDYNFNSMVCDSLQLDTNNVWGIPLDQFHVIGNPPYSTDPSKQNTTPLYDKFIDKYIGANTLLFVVPSRWFIGGKGLGDFRKRMMNRNDIKVINHEDDTSKWFSNVSIEGGVNYFLKDSEYTGKCIFNGHEYNLSKYDCIIHPKYHILIDIIINNNSIDRLYMGRCFGIETNAYKKGLLKDKGDVTCYVSLGISKDRIKYTDDYVFNEKNRFWKVITSRANGGKPNFGAILIGKPNEIHTGSYISFKVKSEEEAKSLKSYLETKFSNYMLSIRKVSQDISGNTCKWIPLVPLDRTWDDEKIKLHFNFSDEHSLLYS